MSDLHGTKNNDKNTDAVREPRPSFRAKAAAAAVGNGDGDVWEEFLMVCQLEDKLVVRSYFKNSRTQKKVWDEPPTGASHVQAASATMRHQVEDELKNLQLAMDVQSGNNSHENVPNETDGKNDDKKKSKKGRGIFNMFRKKPKDTIAAGTNKSNTTKKNKHGKSAPIPDGDEDIQRAISLSMGLQTDSDTVATTQQAALSKYNKDRQWQEDQEALEMAKAISMSEAEAQRNGISGISSEPTSTDPSTTTTTTATAPPHKTMMGEEILQRAMLESRRTAPPPINVPAAAAMPPQDDNEVDLLGFASDSFANLDQPYPETAAFMEDSNSSFWEKKMPAKPTPSLETPSKTTTQNKAISFDPYSAAVAAAGNQESPAAAATTTKTAAAAAKMDTSTQPHALRKMDEKQKPAAAANRMIGRMFNKHAVEEEAGIV